MTESKNWTTVGVRRDTHAYLKGEKMIKSEGTLENFDDVIRRKSGLPAFVEEKP